jgi:hypothetical protein
MPNWKRNGWKNLKEACVANKSLRIALDAAIAMHRRADFSWVKAHSGLVHNEIAGTLAPRGIKGSSYCPTNRFDVLPADTGPEDVFDAQSVIPIVTQVEEWDEEILLPPFSSRVTSLGLEQDEKREIEESTFNSFSRNVLRNSSAPVSDDSDVQQGEDTLVMTGEMRVASNEEQEEQGELEPEPEVTTLPTIEFKPWSGNWTWTHPLEADRREKAERLAFQQEFGWMREADHCLIGHGPHPVAWERFIGNAGQIGSRHFKAIECRKPQEDQGVSLEDTYIGLAIVIWNQSSVAPLDRLAGHQCQWKCLDNCLNGCSGIFRKDAKWIWSLKRKRFRKR